MWYNPTAKPIGPTYVDPRSHQYIQFILWSLDSSYTFVFFILIAGRINIGQLTLSSLFFICLLTVALRFMFVLDYVQHDVSKFVSNNIVCKTTSGEAEHQRFAFCSGAFVYASQLLDWEAPNQRIPVLPRYPIGIFFVSWVKTQNVDASDIFILGALICYVFLYASRRDTRKLQGVVAATVRVSLDFWGCRAATVVSRRDGSRRIHTEQ